MPCDGGFDEAVVTTIQKGNQRKAKKEHLKTIKGNELKINVDRYENTS